MVRMAHAGVLGYYLLVPRDLKTWIFGEEKDFSAYIEDEGADIWRDWLKLRRHQRLAQELRRQLVYRLPYSLRHQPRRLRSRLEEGPRAFLPTRIKQVLVEREICATKKLVYRSSYIHVRGEEDFVEGYFALNKGSYDLTIIAAGSVACEVEEAWACGNIFCGGVEALIVPGDAVDDEIIAEAIRRWYISKIEWKRSLWTRDGRCRLPEIVVDLAWQEAGEQNLPDRDLLCERYGQERHERFRRFGDH